MTDWRIRRPVTAADVFEVAARTRGRKDFGELLDGNFAGAKMEIRPGTAVDNAEDARGALYRMNSYFLLMSYMHVAEQMKLYCETAIASMVGRDHGETETRRSVSFPDGDGYYCAITALHDMNGEFHFCDVDLLLENAFLLQTIANDVRGGGAIPLGRTVTELRRYVRRYERVLGNCRKIVDPNDDVDPTRFKTEIASFSDAFCSSSSYPPFVRSKDIVALVDETAAAAADDDPRNTSRFVRYAFRTETCEIDVSILYHIV